MTADETQSSRDPRQDLKGPALGYPTHAHHMPYRILCGVGIVLYGSSLRAMHLINHCPCKLCVSDVLRRHMLHICSFPGGSGGSLGSLNASHPTYLPPIPPFVPCHAMCASQARRRVRPQRQRKRRPPIVVRRENWNLTKQLSADYNSQSVSPPIRVSLFRVWS